MRLKRVPYHINGLKALRQSNTCCEAIIYTRANDDLFGVAKKLSKASGTSRRAWLRHVFVYSGCLKSTFYAESGRILEYYA
jgi:hypothetical protein